MDDVLGTGTLLFCGPTSSCSTPPRTMLRRLSLLSPRLWAPPASEAAAGQSWATARASVGVCSAGAGGPAGLRSLSTASVVGAGHPLLSLAEAPRVSGGITRRSMAVAAFERTKKHANIGSIGHVDHGTCGCGCCRVGVGRYQRAELAWRAVIHLV